MTMNTEQILSWVNNFKNSWLPQNIPNDRHLSGLITHKLNELENILNQNTQDEHESSEIDVFQSDHSNMLEQVDLPTQETSESSLPTPSGENNHNDEDIENREQLYRPAIRIKRIPLAEAELFIPEEWKITKSKRGRRKGQKKLPTIISNGNTIKKSPRKIKAPLTPTQDTSANEVPINVRKSPRGKKSIQHKSTSSLISIPSTNSDQQKRRRKLRATGGEDDDLYTLGNLSQSNHANGDMECEQVPRYIGQNGILSQTRKTNETTTTVDDDFIIRSQSQQTNFDETLSNRHTSDNHNHTVIPDGSIAEPMNILGDVSATEREQMYRDMVENDDNESLLISLDRSHEPTSTSNNHSIINYNYCVEDISNDGIDPPSSSPSVAHIPLTT